MKALILGDYHHVSVFKSLEAIIRKEKPNSIISLGDYDRMESVMEFLKIAKKCRKKRIKVIEVPGNHDHAVINFIDISSETLAMMGKDVYDIREELDELPEAKKYFKRLLRPENMIRRFPLGKFNVVVVHGAYDGDSCGDLFHNMADNLWFRIYNQSELKKNFEIMAKRKENLMIRGHDHDALLARCIFSVLKKGIVIEDNIFYSHPHAGTVKMLDPDSSYIISPGAFYEGRYAVLESGNSQRLKITYKDFEVYDA